METPELFQQLGISLVLGLLIGLQREKTDASIAGMRTFALISILGTVSMMIAQETANYWIPATALVGVVVFATLRALSLSKTEKKALGTTTEIAILLTFITGAFLVVGPAVVAVAIGGGTAVLLQFKTELHGIAKQLGDKDVKAIMQFVLITCVILPVVPNETFDYYGVLNPFEIWMMVVLIVGVGLGGYILYKFFGSGAGVLLGSALGGAVSSTATTVSYARRAAGQPTAAPQAAVAIMIASTIVHIRVLIEIFVVSPKLLSAALIPILTLMGACLVPAMVMWFWVRKGKSEMPEPSNPAQLKSAILFGVMYAIVLFGLAVARDWIPNDSGMFVIAAFSGMTDMDAITLSSARMVEESIADSTKGITTTLGWKLVVIGILSNLVFKALLVAALSTRRLFLIVSALFAIPFTVGMVLLLWGDSFF